MTWFLSSDSICIMLRQSRKNGRLKTSSVSFVDTDSLAAIMAKHSMLASSDSSTHSNVFYVCVLAVTLKVWCYGDAEGVGSGGCSVCRIPTLALWQTVVTLLGELQSDVT